MNPGSTLASPPTQRFVSQKWEVETPVPTNTNRTLEDLKLGDHLLEPKDYKCKKVKRLAHKKQDPLALLHTWPSLKYNGFYSLNIPS